MKRYNRPDYNDARKRIRTFIKANHRLPNYCQFKNINGKYDRLNREEYCGLFQGYMQFYLKHGREPNYLTLNSEANYPLVINYQDDPYSCGVASLQMCLQFLFDYKYESYIKKTLGTNKNGTTPTQLITGAKKLGYKVTIIPRTFKEVKKALDNYCPVILQIETKSAGNCLSYRNSYGHYIMCYKADTNKYYVMDPTKGPKVCNATTLNKATGGSKHRKFYKVEMI
jgi:predicted double-glycine peptidase